MPESQERRNLLASLIRSQEDAQQGAQVGVLDICIRGEVPAPESKQAGIAARHLNIIRPEGPEDGTDLAMAGLGDKGVRAHLRLVGPLPENSEVQDDQTYARVSDAGSIELLPLQETGAAELVPMNRGSSRVRAVHLKIISSLSPQELLKDLLKNQKPEGIRQLPIEQKFRRTG